MAGMTATGLEARPMPARRGAWAIYEVFKTADEGQLFIGVTSDQQWARFVEEFSLQELAADPRLATNVMRLAERAWLIPALQDILAKIPQAEVEARCERAKVSWARVGQPGDLFSRPPSAGDRRPVGRFHLPNRRNRRQKGRIASPANRIWAAIATGQGSGDSRRGWANTPTEVLARQGFPPRRSRHFWNTARSSVPRSRGELNKPRRHRTGRSGIRRKRL